MSEKNVFDFKGFLRWLEINENNFVGIVGDKYFNPISMYINSCDPHNQNSARCEVNEGYISYENVKRPLTFMEKVILDFIAINFNQGDVLHGFNIQIKEQVHTYDN